VQFNTNSYSWPLYRSIGNAFCRRTQEFTCRPCKKCTPSTVTEGHLQNTMWKVPKGTCRTPCGQAESIFFNQLNSRSYRTPERVYLSSTDSYLHQPGIWIVAINPDHTFLIETDGNNNFKIFQAFSYLYSYQFWVNNDDDSLCGIYNSRAQQMKWQTLDMNRLTNTRDRYGKNQVISGLSDFFNDLKSNLNKAQTLSYQQSHKSLIAMKRNDLYSLPSMHYIFGGSMINFPKYLSGKYSFIKNRIYFRRAL